MLWSTYAAQKIHVLYCQVDWLTRSCVSLYSRLFTCLFAFLLFIASCSIKMDPSGWHRDLPVCWGLRAVHKWAHLSDWVMWRHQLLTVLIGTPEGEERACKERGKHSTHSGWASALQTGCVQPLLVNILFRKWHKIDWTVVGICAKSSLEKSALTGEPARFLVPIYALFQFNSICLNEFQFPSVTPVFPGMLKN